MRDSLLWKVLTCSVGGCRNTTNNKHLLFHELPDDDQQCKLWIKNMNLTNEDDDHYVCSVHFTANCYTRREDDGKRLLIRGAVPTILSVASGHSDPPTYTLETNAEEPDSKRQKVAPSPAERSARLLVPQLQKESDKYKRLYEKEKKTTTRLMEVLSKMFTEDQVTALLRGHTRGTVWGSESINQALQLKLACGNSGYEALLNLGIPLPCLATLKKKAEKLESQT